MLTFCVLALPLLVQEPDLNKRVTYQTPAVSVKLALAGLTEQAGFPLMTSQAVDGEIVVIKVKDVPLHELMKRVATATSCTWAPEAGGYRLIRPASISLQEEEAERRADADLFRKNIAKLVESESKHGALTPASAAAMIKRAQDIQEKIRKSSDNESAVYNLWSQMEELRKASPASRIGMQFVAGLDPVRLAAIPPGERRVFSSFPNRMQWPLAANAQSLLAEYVKEQTVLTKAGEAAGIWKQGGADDEMDYGMDLPWMPMADKPAKVLVIASRQAQREFISLEVRFLDANGAIVETATESLGPEYDEEGESFRKLMEPVKGDKPIQMSPITKAFTDYIMKTFMGFEAGSKPPEKNPLPPELVEFFLNPEKTDPLQLFLSDGVLQLTTAQFPNVVAQLPDAALTMAGFSGPPDKMTVRQLEGLLTASGVVDITKKDGWIEIKSSKPAQSRRLRTDRAALGKFVRTAYAKKAIRLDDVAAFAGKVPESSFQDFGTMYAMFILQDPVSLGGMENWDMLRLYDTMSVGQKSALASGRSLALGGMSVFQQSIVTRMVFYKQDYGGSGEWDQATVTPMGGEPAQEVQVEGDSFMGREPTELLPNGLPGNGFLTLTTSTEHQLKDLDASFFPMANLSPETIATFILRRENPELFKQDEGEDPQVDFMAMMPKLKRLSAGIQATYDFTFALRQNYRIKRQLRDSFFNDPREYTLETLPPGVKAAVDVALKKMREEYKRIGREGPPPPVEVGASGGGKPPPPGSRD